jgi:hypothetical protein
MNYNQNFILPENLNYVNMESLITTANKINSWERLI